MAESDTRKTETANKPAPSTTLADLAKQGLGTGIIVTLVFLIGRFTDPLVEDLRQQRISAESTKDAVTKLADETKDAMHALSMKQASTEKSTAEQFAVLKGQVERLNDKFDWFVQHVSPKAPTVK